MGATTHHQSAGPVYEEILCQIAHAKLHGSPRQRYTIEMWEPAVLAHSPGGPVVGEGCRQCDQPWPCRFLLNLLHGGLVAERNQVADGSQAFCGLDQGVLKEVGIRFDPALSNDTVQLDNISFGQ
jgi:hypothetical protein